MTVIHLVLRSADGPTSDSAEVWWKRHQPVSGDTHSTTEPAITQQQHQQQLRVPDTDRIHVSGSLPLICAVDQTHCQTVRSSTSICWWTPTWSRLHCPCSYFSRSFSPPAASMFFSSVHRRCFPRFVLSSDRPFIHAAAELRQTPVKREQCTELRLEYLPIKYQATALMPGVSSCWLHFR